MPRIFKVETFRHRRRSGVQPPNPKKASGKNALQESHTKTILIQMIVQISQCSELQTCGVEESLRN
jgi:hypothetical protein